jgi:hypothetical protein
MSEDLSKYQKWIEVNVPDISLGLYGLRGKCTEFSKMMCNEYPELTFQHGYYYCPIWREQEHSWTITPNGSIVDPTKDQFPSKGIGTYAPLEEEDWPIGKCMNCGRPCFSKNGGTAHTCSELCTIELIESME